MIQMKGAIVCMARPERYGLVRLQDSEWMESESGFGELASASGRQESELGWLEDFSELRAEFADSVDSESVGVGSMSSS